MVAIGMVISCWVVAFEPALYMACKALSNLMPYKAYIAFMLSEAYSPHMDYIVQTPKQLSAHLRSLRRAQNLTQAQLGARIGLDQTRIAKIERNPSLVSVGQLLQILAVLDTRVVLQAQGRKRKSATRLRDDTSDW